MVQKWGVIVTDIQGDFTEWKNGSLAVPASGEGFVKNVEIATRRFAELGLPIFGTQDWHPPDHISFAANHPGRKPLDVISINGRDHTLWPSHCVQGTENARVLVDNNLFLAVVKKAQNPTLESYSAFQDESGSRTEMETVLRINGVGNVIIYGIATDYCVRATAMDASALGFSVTVVEALCRGVSAETSRAAVEEMREKGIRIVTHPDGIIKEIS